MSLKHGDLKAAIDEIAKKHGGRVTPRNIIDEARDENHPLHNEFEWSDPVAADKHRLAVAAALLRRIEYIGTDVQGREITAVGYVYDAPSQTHVPLSAVARNKQQSYDLMMQELAACESHIRRAQKIADVIHLRDELDKLLHECIGVRERVAKTKVKPTRRGRGRGGGEARAGV